MYYKRLQVTPPEPKIPPRLNFGSLPEQILIPGEDRSEFDSMADFYRATYTPGNYFEDICVMEAIWHDWRLRRIRKVLTYKVQNTDLGSLLNTPGFRKLMRYEENIARTHKAALRTLKLMKKKAGIFRDGPPDRVNFD